MNPAAKIILIALVMLSAGFLLFNEVLAYQLSVPFIDPKTNQPLATDVTGPAQYIRTFYQFSMGFGALLAILMIVIGGIRYTVSEAVPGKDDAKEQITSAIWGLVLLLASYVILTTINPKLNVDTLDDPFVGRVDIIKLSSGQNSFVDDRVKNLSVNEQTGLISWQYDAPEGFTISNFDIQFKKDGQLVKGGPVGQNLRSYEVQPDTLKQIQSRGINDISVIPILTRDFKSAGTAGKGVKNASLGKDGVLRWETETAFRNNMAFYIRNKGSNEFKLYGQFSTSDITKGFFNLPSGLMEKINSGEIQQIQVVDPFAK